MGDPSDEAEAPRLLLFLLLFGPRACEVQVLGLDDSCKDDCAGARFEAVAKGMHADGSGRAPAFESDDISVMDFGENKSLRTPRNAVDLRASGCVEKNQRLESCC